MLPPTDDTITAQASAYGAAYRGIVRVSGPDSVAVTQRWFRIPVDSCASQGDAAELSFAYASCSDCSHFRPFDEVHRPCIAKGVLTVWGNELPVPCVLYFWPEGRGFTGQLSVELHTIGSQPLLDAVVRTLCESGCRLAVAGEFTLRAFLSGRIDLSQAEAVLGVIDANDGKQLAIALRQLAGGIGRPLVALRERLLEITCHLEAEFDFADEEIEFLDRNLLQSELDASYAMIKEMCRQMQQRTSTSGRPRVVLTGRPNAGKSSLFNAIVTLAASLAKQGSTQGGRTPYCSESGVLSAIVSPHPGTTRDWLEAELQIGELFLTLLDTAGIETVEINNSDVNSDDQPQQLAQSFTRDAMEQAHLVLLCIETSAGLTESEQAFLQENADRTMIVRTKSDLTLTSGENIEYQARSPNPETPSQIQTSSTTGEGLPQLLDLIESRLQRENMHGEVLPATALRCRESLFHAAESLQNALHLLAGRDAPLAESANDDLLTATEMRIALEHIGQMTGAVHNDEILDRIFSRFCIGK